MSGHSKWSSIKHQKGAADAKRGKIFTKLGHAITIAAQLGGGDVNMNPRLALAVEMAKKSNMPKDNIDRAIKRGTGELGGAMAEEATYEGYGPGGTAILIEALTDNRNRTTGDVRSIFNKLGGKLAESGSVAYLFAQRGVIGLASNDHADDEVELSIIDSGASDYEKNDNIYTVYTNPKELKRVKDSLETAGLVVTDASIRFEPEQSVDITDPKTVSQIIKLLEALEELDDVTNVTSNMSVDDTILEKTVN